MTSQTTAGVGAGLAMALAMVAHGGSVLFIDDDAPPGGDGATWDTAYRFLQDALTNASGGGIAEIRIAQGIYRPDRDEANPTGTGSREATFQLLNTVALMGGYAGFGAPDPDARDIDLYETILSGDLLGDDGPDFANNDENSYHVVTGSGTNDSAVLDGFTVTAGNADGAWQLHDGGGGMYNDNGSPTLIACRFNANVASRNGGGMVNRPLSSPTLTNCTFSGNTAGTLGGGGMFNGNDSDPMLTDCTFTGNSAPHGGGMFNDRSNPTLGNCTFAGNTAAYEGGAIRSSQSSPSLTSCTFSDNSASRGGAMVNTYDSHPTLIDCVFAGNVASSRGGAIYDSNDDLTLTNCTFSGNSSSTSGGAIYIDFSSVVTLIDCAIVGNAASLGSGGGIVSSSGSALTLLGCTVIGNEAASHGGAIVHSGGSTTLLDCTLADNTAGFAGGAISTFYGGVVTLVGCVLKNNVADFGGGMNNNNASPALTNCILIGNTANVWGGAMYSAFGDVALTNCTLSGNFADSNGGGLYNFQCSPTLANCTVSLNSAEEDGGGIFNQLNANPALTNCILWGNTDGGPTDESAQVFHLAASQSVINYSCVQGLTGDLGGVGNIGDDPLFIDPDGADNIPGTEDDDLRLQSGSPCIDAAFNNAVPPDTADVDDDGDTTEFTPLDLDGNPRFANDPGTLDTGCGVPVIVDMGAYEFPGDVDQPLHGDLDGDGNVGVLDLLLLLDSWGLCDGCCLADLNTDGTVGILDLLILLSNWGA